MAAWAGRLALVTVLIAMGSMGAINWLGGDDNEVSSISYTSPDHSFFEGADWDAENNRVLLNSFWGGILEVRLNGSSDGAKRVRAEQVVATPKDGKDLWCNIRVDLPRDRVLVTFARLKSDYSALAAFDLHTWERLFLKQLAGPESRSFADDIAIDEEGNAYVTDTKGALIWKVSPDGSQSSILTADPAFKASSPLPFEQANLHGIVYHPDGYILVDHCWAGALFRVSLDGTSVHRVNVTSGSILLCNGLALLSPRELVVASALGTKLVVSSDGWETAQVTHKYSGLAYRLGTSVFVKGGKPFTSFSLGFGIGEKLMHIRETAFKPV